MQISQIFFTDGRNQLSTYLTGCVEKVKAIAPEMKHVLYNIDMAREFIQTNFGSETIEAFDKLNPYAYKADLMRYCLLFEEGGWYFDVGVSPAISNINVPTNIETLVFKDAPIISGTTWTCASAVLYSRPKQKVYNKAIEIVLENCKKKYYGTNALSPTGPSVLGRAFAIDGESPNRIVGEFIALTPLHQNKNLAFVLPDGLIFAYGKPAEGGDLSQMGALGTNNYNNFYASKTVYG